MHIRHTSQNFVQYYFESFISFNKDTYSLGWEILQKSIKGDNYELLKLDSRILQVITGVSLLIPVINLIIHIALKKFDLIVEDEGNNRAFAINKPPRAEEAQQWFLEILESTKRLDMDPFESLLQKGEEKGFLDCKCSPYQHNTLSIQWSMLDEWIPQMTMLLKRKVDLSLTEDIFGNTALHWAIANASNGMAMLLINHIEQANILNLQCKRKNTPLHLAVGKGYKDKDSYGKSLMHSNLQLVQALLAKGANPNLQNVNGNTPLHLACLRHDVEMIEVLLKAEATEIPNNEGKLPRNLLNIGHQPAIKMLKVDVAILTLDEQTYVANFEKALLYFN